ncbi:MAG: VWA domain-containing protein [Anaerolineae bacterium]|nr:VWA domain-containing protein [Anaerolineae bacterium]
MSFSTPLALVLLICIPLVAYLGWPRQRFRRVRDSVSLILRMLIMLLLVLAVSGAQLVQSADRLAVIFLMDVSDSVGQTTQEAELEYIRAALQNMSPDDTAGVVLFGANALIERPLNNVRELGTILSVPPSGNTDMEEAIRLALGMFPSNAARRIVVLSDGRPTIGDTESAAELAAATGVEISYVQFTPEASPEVQVTNVNAPSTINAGQDFDLSFTVDAEEAGPATITVLESGAIIHRESVNLRQGTNNYTLSLEGAGAGFKDFQVQVDPEGSDGFYQNNQLSTFSRVVGPPRVLLMYNTEEEIRYLLPALQEAGLEVDTVTPEQLPVGLVPLAQYESIIMADVPATRLTPQRMETIQSFVRDLGGGLVVVGGPNTYGPGGYFQTPLEETLPVEMQIKDQKRLPQLTIAYVIDRSGSMGAIGPSGVENIELAKEAIIRSIDFLQPTDRAGVVSFDTLGYWIARLQDVRDRLALQRLVGSLRVGGGTDILAGMNLVADDIVADPSTRKHIILLTDGGSSPAGLVELTRQLYEESGITTSTIAIGQGVPRFLEDMAIQGGGNYHPVEIVEQVPSIFTQETVLATRSYILEDAFVPTISASSPIVNGISAAPELFGYVATTPKQTAEIILRGPAPYEDPLLASWQYGLGRAVAFTSDASSRWGANWVDWSEFVRFWNQAVRWTITEGTSGNLETQVVMEGEQARLIVDARDNEGAFLNELDMQLSVVDPQANPTLLNLRQVAPGRYEAVFTPDTEGAYILQLRGNGEADGVPLQLDQTTGWVMSYSSEYDQGGRGDGAALLASLAELTGGRSLEDEPSAVFNHNLTSLPTATPIWPWLMLFALVLLPIDIAVRRLIVTRTDLQRLQRWVLGRASAAEETSERIASLIGAKERGRQRAEESGSIPAGTVSALKSRREQSRSEAELPPVITPTEPAKPRYAEKPDTASEAAPDRNVAGQLLKRKKERGGKDE